MFGKHKIVKKPNNSCLALIGSMIEPFRKMTTLALGTLRQPKRQTWCGHLMTQIDKDFSHCMC